MICFGNNTGQSRSFESLLEKTLMDRTPADTFRAGAENNPDIVIGSMKVGNQAQYRIYVQKGTLIQKVMTLPDSLFNQKIGQDVSFFSGVKRAILPIFILQFFVAWMKTTELIAGCNNYIILLFVDKHAGHTAFS